MNQRQFLEDLSCKQSQIRILREEKEQMSEQMNFLSLANECLYEEIDGVSDVIRRLENENEALKAQNAILKDRLDNSIPTPTKFLDFVFGNK